MHILAVNHATWWQHPHRISSMSLFQLELRVPIHRSHSSARYSWNSHWLVSADLLHS